MRMSGSLRDRQNELLDFRVEEPEVAAMSDLTWDRLQSAHDRAVALLKDKNRDKATHRLAGNTLALVDWILQEAYANEKRRGLKGCGWERHPHYGWVKKRRFA